MTKADTRAIEDDAEKQPETEIVNNECEDDNEMITETPELGVDGKNASLMQVVNNSTNNSNNGNGKKRRTPESKLAIDLNDRSKYTEEVSV